MAQIFVYSVEDGRADCWESEIAVRSDTAGAALRRLRQFGLRKNQIRNDGCPVQALLFDALDDATLGPLGLARRCYNDGGWTPWAPVPEGFPLNWRDSGEVRVGGGVGGSYRRPG